MLCYASGFFFLFFLSCFLSSFLVVFVLFIYMAEDSMQNFLYLHPNKNSSMPLVLPVLDSSNYHSRSLSIIIALSTKNKVEFIPVTESRPSKTDATFSAWTCCKNMVVSWLVHLVSIPIRQSIIWMDTTVDIWNDLKMRYL